MGQPQDGIDLVSSTETSTNHQLPDNYTTVPAVALQKEAVAVPKPPYEMKAVDGRLDRACEKETLWLKLGIQLMGVEEELVKGDAIAWSAYHASLQDRPTDAQAAITQLMPLFYEKAATPAMIKHGMNVLRDAIHFLNPGQVPVIAMDAPLFALAKLTQWR